MERAEEGSEGGHGGGDNRELEGCLGDDVRDDAGECRVGILLRGEVEEANGNDGNETVSG